MTEARTADDTREAHIDSLAAAREPVAPAEAEPPGINRRETSPLAWALVMVGAFTVTDDSKQLCTMALGDINSVARRMEDWLSQHPEMASPPPLDVERLARALDDALATNDAHIQHEPSGYHMPAVGLANSIARAYAAEEGS